MSSREDLDFGKVPVLRWWGEILCPFSTRASPPKSSLPLIWVGVEGEVPASSYAMQVHFQRVGAAGVQSRSHSPNQMLEQGQRLETEQDL